jgi:hypothetical protein
MRKLAQFMIAITSLSALTGCGGNTEVASVSARPTGPMANQYGRARGLIGADARRLVAMLGTPRLDIRDRTVRKLQFVAGRCVIDAYLYAPAKGREPLATHIDSRLTSGEKVDIAACGLTLQE